LEFEEGHDTRENRSIFLNFKRDRLPMKVDQFLNILKEVGYP
jgi:hypothetical protein